MGLLLEKKEGLSFLETRIILALPYFQPYFSYACVSFSYLFLGEIKLRR